VAAASDTAGGGLFGTRLCPDATMARTTKKKGFSLIVMRCLMMSETFDHFCFGWDSKQCWS
jgi:hypothetical protein